MLVAFNVEDFDRLIRGAGCESAAIEVEDGVVDDVVVAGVGDDLSHGRDVRREMREEKGGVRREGDLSCERWNG